MHTGEKPYICTYPDCSGRFRESSNLHSHIKRNHLKNKHSEDQKTNKLNLRKELQIKIHNFFKITNQDFHSHI